MQTATSNYLNR